MKIGKFLPTTTSKVCNSVNIPSVILRDLIYLHTFLADEAFDCIFGSEKGSIYSLPKQLQDEWDPEVSDDC